MTLLGGIGALRRGASGQGFQLLRFSNRETMTELEPVLDTTFAAIGEVTRSPYPSPKGSGDYGGD
jgi:hypothetical protein